MASEVKVVLTGVDNASPTIDKVSASAGGLSVAGIALGTVLGGVLTKALDVAVDGFRAMVSVMVDAFNEAQQSEIINVKLARAIDNTGRQVLASTEAADGLAQAMRDLAGGEDDSVKGAEIVLLRFREISKTTFPDALKVSADLAAAMGIDMEQAAQMLGRALENPANGMRTLRQVGVNFNEAEMGVIQSLMDTGRAAEAQNIVMAALSGTVGGMADAVAGTVSGKWSIFKNHMDDVTKGIAERFLPIVSRLMDQYIMPMIPVIEELGAKFGTMLATKVTETVDTLTKLFDIFTKLTSLFVSVFDGVMGISRGIDQLNSSTVDWVGLIGRFIINIEWITTGINDLFMALNVNMTNGLVGFDGIMFSMIKVGSWAAGLLMDFWNKSFFVQFLNQAFGINLSIQMSFLELVASIQDNFMNFVYYPLKELFEWRLAVHIQNFVGQIKYWFNDRLPLEWQRFKRNIEEYLGPDPMRKLGEMLIKGISDGITAGWYWLLNAIKWIGDQAIAGFKRIFGIYSPSKVFHGFGANMMQGLADGIKSAAGVPQSALTGIGMSMSGIGATGGGSNVSRSNSTTYNYTAHYGAPPANDPVASFSLLRAMVSA